MKPKDEKITKVIFEYETHSRELVGEEAEKWLDTVNGMCVLAQNRGQNPFESQEFEWREVQSEAPTQSTCKYCGK